jgi:hypothetical protein
MEIELRSKQEIQAAHDRLVAIIVGDVPKPYENPHWLTSLRISASVLCWVLKHDHNSSFAETLDEIDAFLAARGIVLQDSGRLQIRGDDAMTK